MSEVTRKPLTMDLPTPMQGMDLIEANDQLVDLELELADAVQEASDAAAEARKKIKDIKKRKLELAKDIKARRRTRSVACEEVTEFPRRKYVIRLDTKEIVPGTEKALSGEELQVPLVDLGEKANGAPANGAPAPANGASGKGRASAGGTKSTKKPAGRRAPAPSH